MPQAAPAGSSGPAVPIERDAFLCDLLGELSGCLQEVVGLDEASGFVSIVGERLGHRLSAHYRGSLGVDTLDRGQVASTLVDFKHRIAGDFSVLEESEEKIVLANNRCPFGASVRGRPALCMMTSNAFGAIAADNLGYAKVELQDTIANGDPGCRVVVHLKISEESEAARGREYFRVPETV